MVQKSDVVLLEEVPCPMGIVYCSIVWLKEQPLNHRWGPSVMRDVFCKIWTQPAHVSWPYTSWSSIGPLEEKTTQTILLYPMFGGLLQSTNSQFFTFQGDEAFKSVFSLLFLKPFSPWCCLIGLQSAPVMASIWVQCLKGEPTRYSGSVLVKLIRSLFCSITLRII